LDGEEEGRHHLRHAAVLDAVPVGDEDLLDALDARGRLRGLGATLPGDEHVDLRGEREGGWEME
jgi:hypothetical protein